WLQLWRELSGTEFDLLYVNSFWNPAFSVIPILAVRLRILKARKLLLAPRGELNPGALSINSKKKRLFLRWWKRILKGMDVIWQASSEKDASSIRAAIPWAHVEVAADQGAFPTEPMAPREVSDNGTRLVFIGRI